MVELDEQGRALIQVTGTVLEDLVVRIHKADNDEFHWTAYAKNGRKVGTTGETYESQQHAAAMASELYPTARIKAVDGGDWQFEGKSIA